jgi:uncharacterized protein YdhG (YjbR/CyaY superfamily)
VAKQADPKKQVADYIAAQPPKARRALKAVRATIRAVAPKAEEAFSYRIPGFRLDGKAFVWYAGFTNHYSMFPIGTELARSLGKAAEGYETAKGTIRFPLSEPVPVPLIKKIVKARIAQMKSRGK